MALNEFDEASGDVEPIRVLNLDDVTNAVVCTVLVHGVFRCLTVEFDEMLVLRKTELCSAFLTEIGTNCRLGDGVVVVILVSYRRGVDEDFASVPSAGSSARDSLVDSSTAFTRTTDKSDSLERGNIRGESS